MLSKIINFVHPVKFASQLFSWIKTHQADIILVIGVILISLFSFAVGYIVAKNQEKTPIRFESII